MTIVTTILRKTIEGNRRVVYGKSVIGGVTDTGEVIVPLYRILFFKGTVAAAAASACSANETFPLAGSTPVTIVTSNNDETVYWRAVGDPC
jgi:hypothetical protein